MKQNYCADCARPISRQGVCCKSCAGKRNVPRRGFITTPETKAKLSAANLGKKRSEETKARLAASKLGPLNPHWNGGRSCIRGYVILSAPDHPKADVNGYVPEHRLVLERKLGRPLEDGRVVHHIDMDITNNSPDNLVALSIGDHRRYHARLNRYIAHM